jgi:glycosyltransferase involved in cell wall biosynthesis
MIRDSSGPASTGESTVQVLPKMAGSLNSVRAVKSQDQKAVVSTNRLRVSLGMPVFNGEAFLEPAIASILAQTYRDFELIISDNASTDDTQTICTKYAAMDKRIRYYRNAENIGAVKNFNRVFELSSGEYFKWVAHDDFLAPDFLQRCVQVLDEDLTVVLCYSKAQIVDEFGQVVGIHNVNLNNISSGKPHKRFGDLVLINHWCLPVFGLIRSSVLGMTSLISSHIGSDRNLLAELSLLGRFYQIPEFLFFSRDHARRSIKAIPLHLRGAWLDPDGRKYFVLPRWRLVYEYLRSVRRVPLDPYERTRCYLLFPAWLWRYWKSLGKDLFVAAGQLLHMFVGRDDVRQQENTRTDRMRSLP